MLTMNQRFPSNVYDGMALIADPILYAFFTAPGSPTPRKKREKDIIDSPWMQRLRRIYQLQSARWVYPAAEHTRFQHSLGAMRIARPAYPPAPEVARMFRQASVHQEQPSADARQQGLINSAASVIFRPDLTRVMTGTADHQPDLARAVPATAGYFR